mgnify:CR=1 FL=1
MPNHLLEAEDIIDLLKTKIAEMNRLRPLVTTQTDFIDGVIAGLHAIIDKINKEIALYDTLRNGDVPDPELSNGPTLH